MPAPRAGRDGASKMPPLGYERMEDPKPLSVAEFLAWEARQSTNHELIDGVIVAMSNPTKAPGRD